MAMCAATHGTVSGLCALSRSNERRHVARTLWAAVAPLIVLARLLAAATTVHAQGPDVPAGELVRQTVANEVRAANAGGHYMYRLTKVTPSGSETQQIIETREWAIGRMIRRDGRPLTSREQQQEVDRLNKLRRDPRRVKALQETLHHDEQRVRRLMRALPDAFEYEYGGTGTDEAGRSLLRLTFRPNHAYDPPSRDLAVLTGMEGTMLIDATARRLVRVEAALVRDVDFGWGILGRLYRGGEFLLEQRNVGADRWAISTLRLHFKGRVLLLKSINIDSLMRTSDFRRMPDDLTLEQGLARLLAQGETTDNR